MTARLPVACALALTLASCAVEPQPQTAGSIDLAAAAVWFAEFDELCNEDAGALWGVSFCGPVLVVDPPTRMAVANRQSEGGAGVLKPVGDLFVGELPAEVGIANTAMEWDGTRWTMLMVWSIGDDSKRRLRLMAHEAFHRLQPQLNLAPYGDINAHLDTADGRYWLQLEWNALQQALSAGGDARARAVADALAFRAARRDLFPQAAARETPLEIFEGLAEYSGMRLAGYKEDEVVQAVAAKREGETGLVRSFAYVTGPLYGYLLDGADDGWRQRVSATSDLGALLAASMSLPPTPQEPAARAEGYGGPPLRAAETAREAERTERLAAWREQLIDGPLLIVDLTRVSSGGFDPGKVFPFDDKRTVYTTRELIADWGVLNVSDGAILEDDSLGRGQVSLAGASDDRLEGAGWRLELADGWTVVEGEREGDFTLAAAELP